MEPANEINTNSEQNIDYNLYKDEPDKLFLLAEQDFDKNEFEKGLQVLEKSINLALEKYGSETKIEMAKYFNEYGAGLIRKLMENDDILNLPNEPIENKEKQKNENTILEKEENEDKKEENVEKKEEKEENVEKEEENVEKKEENVEKVEENEDKKEENVVKKEENEDKKEENINLTNDEKKEENILKDKNEDEEKQNEQEDSDENIALENLGAANKLYTDYLKEYDDKEVSTLSKEVINYYLELADNYYNIGCFQRVKSDFKTAANLFEKAISIRKKYGDKYSRKLASLYFEEAQVLDYDPHKCLLVLFKAKLIMEYHLKLALENSNLKIEIGDNDLELNEIKTDDKRIYLNRNIIESEEMNKEAKNNSKVDEFQGIIKDIYPKIEDVILEINEFEQYTKEKEKMLNNGSENKFNTNYDSSKVIDITQSSLIKKKRPREKEPEELDMENEKEKITENHNA